MHIKRITILLFLIASLLPFPSFAAELITASQKTRPSWIFRVPEDEKNAYFVGNSPHAPSLGEGKTQAISDAAEKILRLLRVRENTRRYVEKKAKIEDAVMQGLSSGGKTPIQGLDLLDGYYEQYKDIGTGTYFNVYVFVRYSRSEVNNEITRLGEESVAKVREAEKAFNLSAQKEKAGNVGLALKGYSLAFEMLEDIPEGAELSKKIEDRIRQTLSLMRLEPYEDNKIQKTMQGMKNPAMVRLIYKGKKDELTVADYPVSFSFIEGGGVLENETASTDEHGIAKCRVLGLDNPYVKNTVEFSLRCDVADPKALPRARFSSSTSGSRLFEKTYELAFGGGEETESIGFYDGEELVAVLEIKLASPGSSEEIFFTLKKAERGAEQEISNMLFLPPQAELTDAGEQIGFSAEECGQKTKWQKTLSCLEISAEILSFATKRYFSTFTGSFIGFEKLDMRIAVALK